MQPGAGVETCMQAHRAAGGQRGQHLYAQPAHVKQRQHGQRARVCIKALGVDGGSDVGRHAGGRVHRALGRAGGARGVDEQPVARQVAFSAFAWQGRDGCHGSGQVGMRLVVQQALHVGMLDDQAQFHAGQAPVQRQIACADAPAGLQQRQRAQAVETQPGDGVARAQAGGAQRGHFGIRGPRDVVGLQVHGPGVHASIASSRSPGSYRHSRPRRSTQSSAVQGSIRLPQRLSR